MNNDYWSEIFIPRFFYSEENSKFYFSMVIFVNKFYIKLLSNKLNITFQSEFSGFIIKLTLLQKPFWAFLSDIRKNILRQHFWGRISRSGK